VNQSRLGRLIFATCINLRKQVRTTIGFGSQQEGTGEVHGTPLGADSLKQVKTKFEFDPKDSFHIDPNVKKFYEQAVERGQEAESQWSERWNKYSSTHPDLAAEFARRQAGKFPEGWQSKLPKYTGTDQAKATRQWSQSALQVLSELLPELVGGSADLTPSNGTALKKFPPFTKDNRLGRYLHFGVREHAMAGICNGIAAYGLNFIPFGATFLNFIEYGYGAVRLSALSHLRVIWIMTHDSIGLGEDGPTHQPVEANALIRATPNLLFIRPGDGNEVSGAFIVALESQTRPSVLALSRQSMPALDGTAAEKVALGAYTLHDVPDPSIVLVGTGSELHLCVEGAKELVGQGVKARVVSMPCVELFEEQSMDYQRSLFPAGVPVLSVEALSSLSWARISHAQIAVDKFGMSGPSKAVLEKYGFTVKNVVERATALLRKFPNSTAPDLVALRGC